ncbi:glycosyltransferase [Acinetobacter guerrae]|uniref:glycosyltransferase n=1 Tax=Acinetobacter guerrae TaxID=1843371 RepID=UPI00128E6805|nr:glycosyltransferase [Acinetobacter guerrae]MPW44392.1 hypothetical protein [Acinetobacter guerrae]
MKILVIVPDLAVGGVTSVVVNLVKKLKKEFNARVFIVTLFSKNDVQVNDIEVFSLNISSISGVFKGFFLLKDIIEKSNPDVIHSHTLYPHLLINLLSLLYKKKYKLINSEHGTYSSKLKFYKRMNFFRILNPQAELVTNVSVASCESYINANIVKREKIKLIYNGIDTKKYYFSQNVRDKIRKTLNIDEKIKVIGYVGRLSTEKNVTNLIEAILRIHSINLKLIIIGDGPERENLERLVSEKQLNDRVFFLGALTNVNEYYSAFDLLVLSSNTEGLPTVLLEAISSNCLVASTDCGGVKEILPDNYEFLAKPNSPEELSLIINKLLNLDSLIVSEIKESCFKKVEMYFSNEAMCQSWWRVYNEL